MSCRQLDLVTLLFTVAQLFLMFRGRWLKYRAATERLRENCMRFCTHLRPFNHNDAEQKFRIALDELDTELGEKQKLNWNDLIPWRYLTGLKPLPEELRDELPHAPDDGLCPCRVNNLDRAERLTNTALRFSATARCRWRERRHDDVLMWLAVNRHDVMKRGLVACSETCMTA